ncbi:MAG: choice-of-anchor D domain-containing protein [Bryobacterales bacterium]|nr:choice-of-anchor D domain-containing protein [Bryobacterales bacterium]
MQSITVGGVNFAGVGIPLPNTTVDANRTVQFTVQFTPKSLDASVGSMTITAAGATSNFSLSGNGTGAQFSYAVSTPDGSTPLNIGGLVTVPDAVVGEKSSVTVRVRNTGNADARIATLAVNGTGYTITDAPLIPVTVPIGVQIAFTLNFAPTTTGRAAGRLRIGGDDFEVASNGLGAALTLQLRRFRLAHHHHLRRHGQLPPRPHRRESNNVTFTITNSGTSPTTVNSIGLTAASPSPP